MVTTATPPCVYDNFKSEKDVSPIVDLMVPKHVVNLKTWQNILEILLCVTETVELQHIISDHCKYNIKLRFMPLCTSLRLPFNVT